jgi:hypothetical protein
VTVQYTKRKRTQLQGLLGPGRGWSYTGSQQSAQWVGPSAQPGPLPLLSGLEQWLVNLRIRPIFVTLLAFGWSFILWGWCLGFHSTIFHSSVGTNFSFVSQNRVIIEPHFCFRPSSPWADPTSGGKRVTVTFFQ